MTMFILVESCGVNKFIGTGNVFADLRKSMEEEMNRDHNFSLERMRLHFSDYKTRGLELDDSFFLRYLRARNFDYDKSSKMLNATLHWKSTFGHPDDSWNDLISIENSTGKMYCRGFDKFGHSIIYMKPKYENTYNHNGNLKHLVYNIEKSILSMKARGNQEKVLILIDFDEFSLHRAPPFKTSLETLSILQNHYPERLYKAYCIRPPWIFSTFWNMISPFIDHQTKQKIIMLPSNSLSEIKTVLTEEIDEHVLEASLGGNDSRPFDSKLYVAAPFHVDFHTILENVK